LKIENKISIVTVTLNAAETISRCLKSIPDIPEIEHIVVDGRSDDGTEDVLNQYASSKKNLIFLQELESSGIYNAINYGVSIASGKYIQIVNGDDEFTGMEYLYDILSQESSILIFKQKVFSGHHKIAEVGYKTSFSYPCQSLPWAHGSMLIHRKVYAKVGLYDVQYKLSSDLDWVNRALSYECEIKFFPYSISNFYMGGASTTTTKGLAESFDIYKKWGGGTLSGRYNFFRSYLIKILARIITWERLFNIKRKIKFKKGIWK
jgi:glycosyltransferase involved in cell wall biosynthesis